MTGIKKSSPHTLFNSNLDNTQHFRLFLDDLIHEGAQIHDMLNLLHDAGDNDTLEIRINSNGGFIRYGQQLINVISGKFSDRCLTVIESDAASMAALVFMAGTKRVIYEHSTLMVHDMSMYLVGKASESKKQLMAETYAFKNKFKRLFEDCLSEDEIEGIFEGKDEWFNAQEMCERGIATHVFTDDGLVEADVYVRNIHNPELKLKSELEAEIRNCRAIIDELEKKKQEYSKDLIEAEGELALIEEELNDKTSNSRKS